jgi:hypothetical protein
MAHQSTTFDTIRKSAFKNVRTILLAANISDITTKVYGSYPLTNISLPLLVVKNGLVQSNEQSHTLSGLNSKYITVIVDIFAKEAEKIDTYADAVDAAIRAAKSTFATYNMILRDDGVTDNEDIVFTDINNNRTHGKSISLTFEVDA